MVEDANKIINSYIKNQLIENYLNCRQGIIDDLRSKELWNTCNTDDTGKYLFFIAPTEYPDFNWGAINLKQIKESWSLLQTEILYLIPLPPTFRKNQFEEEGYPEPLYGYQPLPIERYNWTLEFSQIIDSWLMAAVVYETSSLSKEDRFEVISQVVEISTIFEACHALHFSEKDCELTWESVLQSIPALKKVTNNQIELISNPIFGNIDETHNNHVKRYENIQRALHSTELWNICNTYERGQYLFFLASLNNQDNGWSLIDIEDDDTYQEITELIPGLIEVPCPPAFKYEDLPRAGYQPTATERYEWTLELARRLDAWLAAVISYSVSLSAKEDKLRVYKAANTITLAEACSTWKFTQEECKLNWEE